LSSFLRRSRREGTAIERQKRKKTVDKKGLPELTGSTKRVRFILKKGKQNAMEKSEGCGFSSQNWDERGGHRSLGGGGVKKKGGGNAGKSLPIKLLKTGRRIRVKPFTLWGGVRRWTWDQSSKARVRPQGTKRDIRILPKWTRGSGKRVCTSFIN